jgi:uncharacterized protein (DUF58 family)
MQAPNAKGIKQTLKRLQLLVRQLVDGFATGIHKSPQRGASVQFKQHRPYVPGDDVRRIDWKIFARSDRYYVREFEQETNLRATLLLDLSGSMNYKGANSQCSKAEYARQMCLCLAGILLRQQDSTGLVTFDQKIRTFIPHSTRPSHLKTLEAALLGDTPGGETSLALALAQTSPLVGKRGLLLIITDCLDDIEALLAALGRLRIHHHEILIFQILDRDELEFPFKEWTRFESLETIGKYADVDPAALKSTYLENLTRFQTALSTGCKKNGIPLFTCITDAPLEKTIAEHLRSRTRRGAPSFPCNS